jgi:CheY-like chemotaxis protein
VQEGSRVHTLLYVEDNPANMKLVEQLVSRRADLRLLTAVEANSGIELARTCQPDVILMDINLPGISGVAAMRILRQYSGTAHIPIVAISANAMPRDIENGLAAGFFRYLTKPIKVKQFEEAVTAALAFANETGRTGSDYREVGSANALTEAETSDEGAAALPDELRSRLQEAGMNADHELLLQLIVEVEAYDKAKSRRFRDFVGTFDYRSLLDALQAER